MRSRNLLPRLWRHKKNIVLWVLVLCFFFGGTVLLWASTLKIPSLSSIENREVEQSVQIYDRTGTVLLYALNRDTRRIVVPLTQVSPDIQHAVISVEDPTFYQNPGVDWTSLLRAVLVDITSLRKAEGGSTLTQQVVKLTILTGQKAISRKLEEIILALKLTHTLTKDQILEIYLNQAPFGGNMYGVEAASEQFFGVPASQDSLAEAAYLTAMLPAPTYYSPYGPHKSDLDTRKDFVLEKMYERGYITAPQRDTAQKTAVVFQPQQDSGITAPHFVFYVEQYLEQKYGPDVLDQNSWKVITTLDADLQTEAESVVKAGVAEDEKKFNASNAGLIALDPTNGQILAMVGSRNYFDTQIDGNFNVALAPRQPGSTFKPFAYAEAFEKGYTPNTVLFDAPTQFSTSCAPTDVYNDTPPCYSPQNYDNKFRGPMTLRDAIAQSINVPSVKVLYLAGLSDTLKLAKAMGVSTLGNASQYGLTLVLGGGEVTLLDMTSAYGAFATDGTHYQPVAVLKITDQNGETIEDNSQPTGVNVVPNTVAEEINDILSDPVARAPLGENEYLQFTGRDVAVKTGTTNNYRDAWTIGYTPNFVLGMWVGNNDNTPMTHTVSGFIVGPMWHQIMQYELAKTPPSYFNRSDLSTAQSAKPVLNGTWQGGDAQIINGQEYVACNVHSILYWLDPDNVMGPAPRNNSTDPQYAYWEAGVQKWFAANGGCTPGQPVYVGPAPSLLPPSTTTPASAPITP